MAWVEMYLLQPFSEKLGNSIEDVSCMDPGTWQFHVWEFTYNYTLKCAQRCMFKECHSSVVCTYQKPELIPRELVKSKRQHSDDGILRSH